MALTRFLLELCAPAAIGDELWPGVRLIGASSELGPRLSFDVDGNEVHVEVFPIAEERPSAARSSRLAFAYRSDEQAPVASALGVAVCRRLAAHASAHELVALERLEHAVRSLAQSGGDENIREVVVDRLLEAAGSPAARFYSLSPYVGCLIGCRFCYAQSRVALSRRLEGARELAWGRYVDVRINAAELLERELERIGQSPIKFCPIVSDPYQAIERRYRLTRRCLEVLVRAPPRTVLLLTRSKSVIEDADLIASLPGMYAGISIPTADDEVRRHFEPRAATIAERLAALAELGRAGARTFAVVQPLLPGSIEALADAVAPVAGSVSIDVLHGEQGAAADFADPRFAVARSPEWQRARAAELRAALEARGVAVWRGELPPRDERPTNV